MWTDTLTPKKKTINIKHTRRSATDERARNKDMYRDIKLQLFDLTSRDNQIPEVRYIVAKCACAASSYPKCIPPITALVY
jgi:hypothetical protein